jgi:hypothetical protein
MQVFARAVDLFSETATYLSMAALSAALGASNPLPDQTDPLWDVLVLIVISILCSLGIVFLQRKAKALSAEGADQLAVVTLEKYSFFVIGLSTFLMGGSISNVGLSISKRLTSEEDAGAGFLWGYTAVILALSVATSIQKLKVAAFPRVNGFYDSKTPALIEKADQFSYTLWHKSLVWAVAISMNNAMQLSIGDKTKVSQRYIAAVAITIAAVLISILIEKIVQLDAVDGIPPRRLALLGDFAEVTTFAMAFVVGNGWSNGFSATVSDRVGDLTAQLYVSIGYTLALIVTYAALKIYLSTYLPDSLKSKLISIPLGEDAGL